MGSSEFGKFIQREEILRRRKLNGVGCKWDRGDTIGDGRIASPLYSTGISISYSSTVDEACYFPCVLRLPPFVPLHFSLSLSLMHSHSHPFSLNLTTSRTYLPLAFVPKQKCCHCYIQCSLNWISQKNRQTVTLIIILTITQGYIVVSLKLINLILYWSYNYN